MASSSRNLIVLCDGTGKNGAIQELSLQTNIWRLSRMIDNENGRHLVKYVHGVGSNKQTRGLPARLLGSTVVKQVMAAYMWIVLHYKPGDNICLFGYSRGAFIARKVASLINKLGLVSHPEEFMRYWSSLEHKLPGNRNSVPKQTTVVPIKFLVVWDTVAAVRSTETLREQINLLGIRDDEIPANVEKTLHIVAYHENRRLFDVTLFNQKSNDPRCIQICFSGAHSDVGGGHGHRLHCTLPDVTHNWVVDHISPIIKVERIETTTQAYNLDPDDAYHNSPWWKRIPDKWEPRKQLTRKSWLVAHETLETLKLPDNSKLLKYWGELVSLRRRVTGAIQRGFTLIGRQANLPLVQGPTSTSVIQRDSETTHVLTQSETKPPRLAHFTQAPKTADAPSDINDRNRRVPPLHVVWNMPATSVEHDHNVTSAENPAPWLTTTPVSIPRVSAVPDNYTANTGLQHDPLKLHITCESPVDEESSSLPHPASPYSPENLHSNSKLDKPTPASAPQVIEVKVHPVAQMRIRLAPPPPPLTRRPAVSIRGPRAVPPPPTKKVIPLAESPFVTPVLVLDTRRAECASKQTDMPPRPAVMSGPRVPPLPPRPPKELPAKSSTEKFPSAGYSPVCSAPPAYSLATPAFPPLKTTGSPGAPPLPPRPQQQQLQSSIPTSLRAGFHQGTLSTTKDALPPTIDTSYDKAPKAPPLPPRPRTTIIAPPLPPQTTSIALDPYINTPSSTPSSFVSFPTPYLTICGDNLISPYPNSPFYPQSSSSYTSSEAPWTPANYQYGSPQVPYGGAPAFQMPAPTIPLFFNQFPSQTSSFGNSAPPVTASPWEDAKNGIAGETPYVPYSEYCGVSLEDNSRNIFPVPDDTQRPLFALVIGINAYKNVTPLHGAVADALAFRQYLRDYLLIPERQITTLLDEQATRDNIIQAFQALEKDKRIEEKDAIVIYYAGHGSKLDAPEGWEAGGPHIQALVPQNVKETDASGNPVPAIPDRTIAGLLDNLAHEKGNNITVIFDCCHAASGTRIHGERYVEVPYRMARSVAAEDLPPIPPNVDHDIPAKDRGTVVSKDFAFQGLRSHVLLAACASNESAYETKGRGDFTTALLNLLITSGADKLTYTGCIQKFPSLAGQRPQCEGSIENASRVFFNAKISGANRMFVTVEREDNVCFLNAGIAQGITVGSKFDIYTDHIDNEKNQRLGSMRVVAVEPLRSTLDWEKKEDPFDLPKLSYGYQTKCGAGQDFPIHFTDKFVQSVQEKDGPEWLKGFTANEQSIVFKEADVNTAQFIVDLDEKGDVVFETTHALSNKNGLKRLPYSVPNTVKDVLVVLRSAALWTWHLERTNPEHPFKEGVEVEFTRVVRDGFDEKFRPHRRAEGANLNVSGVADIVARKNEYYGMKIWNNTPRDLYAYLFYFDASTQAIDPWTVSSMKGSKGEANLTARSSFTIGYGSGGQSPFSFVVEDNQELEVGVLKLFVTTVQGEFSTVKHSSPFVVEKGVRGSVTDTDVSQQLASRVDWDTFEITLIQHKDRGVRPA